LPPLCTRLPPWRRFRTTRQLCTRLPHIPAYRFAFQTARYDQFSRRYALLRANDAPFLPKHSPFGADYAPLCTRNALHATCSHARHCTPTICHAAPPAHRLHWPQSRRKNQHAYSARRAASDNARTHRTAAYRTRTAAS